MTKAELRAAILADSHRPDLTAEVDRFIREAEGLIRRDLRAYPLSATLIEANRVNGGLYSLPTGLLEIRALYGPDGFALDQVGLNEIKWTPTGARVLKYAILGTTVDIRGVPGTDAVLPLEYLGRPAALAADGDTNALLNDHETLYREGALFYLYKHTQDLELAQAALDTFSGVLDKLNEAAGRLLGGAVIAPAYGFGCGGSY